MPEQPLPPAASLEIAEEMVAEIWKARAAHLAQAIEQKDDGERLQLLLVRLGREVYGIEIGYVLDIRLLDQVTAVPRVPEWVVGLITNRGRILAVIDLRRYFKLPGGPSAENQAPGGSPPETFQVSVETPAMEVALLVDEVLSVESIPLNQIRNKSDVWGDMPPEAMLGITRNPAARSGQEFSNLIVLNLPALLADKNLIIEEKVL